MGALITDRKEVGARLYFHRHLWFCSQGSAWCRGMSGLGGCLVPGVCLVPGGAWSWEGAWSGRGVPGPRGVPGLGGSGPGGCLVWRVWSRDASYWNAGLLTLIHTWVIHVLFESNSSNWTKTSSFWKKNSTTLHVVDAGAVAWWRTWMSAGNAHPAPQTIGRTSTVHAARSATGAVTVTSPDPDNGTKVRLNYHQTLMLIIIEFPEHVYVSSGLADPRWVLATYALSRSFFFHFSLISEILDPPTNCHSTRM